VRILITEEALEGENGHFPNYVGDIAGKLRLSGCDVDVLAHINASEKVLKQVGGHRWFRRNCRTDRRSSGLTGVLLHNIFIWRDLTRWLHKRPDYDWVLQLASRRQHLLAFTLAAYQKQFFPNGKLLLLFVLGFGEYDAELKKTVFKANLSTLLSRLMFKFMAPLVRRGRLVIAAETEQMRLELEDFTNHKVVLFPHPVEDTHLQDSLLSFRKSKNISVEELAERPLVITCPGFARHEKGSDILLDAVRQISGTPEAKNYRFVFQWIDPFVTPEGVKYLPDQSLTDMGVAEFVEHSLNREEYREMLTGSDIIILPYRRNSYHNRVSRVAIEAAILGIPMIYMSGTWTQEVAEIVGGGIKIESESPDSVLVAIRTALANYKALASNAASGASKARDFYSVAEMIRVLNRIDDDAPH
jgi:glycosyltransferase involved in cell wall biosynthesis